MPQASVDRRSASRAGSSPSRSSSRTAKPAFQPGWTSPAIDAPLKPLVINGVLFAASSGTRSSPAVLLRPRRRERQGSLEQRPGHHLSARGGLSGGQGSVYVPGSDSTLYAFGFEIEK